MPKTDQSFDPDGYATVAERIALFYRNHPQGRITTELVTRDAASVTFKAMVFREAADPVPAATGWATEREGDGDINTVACLENTETSAIGRALANLGFTASKYRPSAEEMRKAVRTRKRRSAVCSAHGNTEEEAAYSVAAAELLTALAAAERSGLARDHSDRVRKKLERRAITLQRINELTRRAHAWIDRNGVDITPGEPFEPQM